MKSQIAVMMIVEAVEWAEITVETITMIRNARLAIGEADRVRICRMEILIAVGMIETDLTTEIGEMTEKVRTFYINFTFTEINKNFNRNKFLKNHLTIEKFFIEQEPISIISQVHGVRETAVIKDPRLETIGAASEMIAGTEIETGTGTVLAIEGEAETETETGAAVSGHVAIMEILIGTAIVVKIEMLRSVSVQLFDTIKYMKDIVSLIQLLIFLFDYDNSAESRQRPKLQLQPRTKPVETVAVAEDSAAKDGTTESKSTANSESTQRAPAATPVPAANIFGAAKPVDTTAREREIEERLAKSYAESRSREETYV